MTRTRYALNAHQEPAPVTWALAVMSVRAEKIMLM
jgi:hypothetical protein